jgi:hypothetical protein
VIGLALVLPAELVLVVDLDLLLADLLGYLALVGDRVRVEADRSRGTTRFSTAGISSWRVTSCSSSEMSGPLVAASRLELAAGRVDHRATLPVADGVKAWC